jgi:ubiquinone/menaquinone biosynthesis C-methylase UbiE
MMWPLFYDLALYPLERLCLGRWRRELIAQAFGQVLEIGAGTGVNMQYYSGVKHLVVSEANDRMLRRASARRAVPQLQTDFVVSDARHLPFGTGTFDTVIATLAFCTIAQPEMAFLEVKRVLRPNGQLLLMEHIRARKPWAVAIQNYLTPYWRHIADGCHLNRDTLELAQVSGFTVVEKHDRLDGWFVAARLTLDAAASAESYCR